MSINIDLQQVSTPEASLAILKSLNGHGGIVSHLSDCQAEERRSVFVPWGIDARSALDLSTPAGSHWRWTVHGETINVIPRENLPSVLSFKVASFQWDTRNPASFSVSSLFALDPVRQFLAQQNVTGALQSGFGLQESQPRNAATVDPGRSRYEIKDSTVLDALNRIVASYGSTVWMYSETSCNGKKEYRIEVR